MNLVKNGAVLLAALGMFAATSCGSKSQTLTLEKAKEWLKDADTEKAERTFLKNQNFAWNFKTTGVGMTPEDPEKLPYGFAQYMLIGYIDQNKMTDTEFAKKFAKLNDNTDYIKNPDEAISKKSGYFFDADELENASDWGTNPTYTLTGGKLHFKYDEEQKTQFDKGGTEKVAIAIDYAIGKDGTVSTINITAKNQEVKGSMTYSGMKVVVVDGTFSGTIKQTITYKEKN